MLSHYVTDLGNITGKRNIIKTCNIATVIRITPCALLIALNPPVW